jgi:hypothetical protein
VVREDVRTLGETIGVTLGGCNNRFGVLAGKEKGKKKVSVVVDGDVGGVVEGAV